MKRRQFNLKAITLLASLTLPLLASHAMAQQAVLRVGLGPQQPTAADTQRVWEPIYKAIADKIGAKLELRVANDWAGISTALANEQLDVAQMGPWG